MKRSIQSGIYSKTISVLVMLSPTLLLSACVNKPEPKTTEIIYITPPASLMVPCVKPKMHGNKWADLAEYAIRLSDELTICNRRIGAINTFVIKQQSSASKITDGK